MIHKLRFVGVMIFSLSLMAGLLISVIITPLRDPLHQAFAGPPSPPPEPIAGKPHPTITEAQKKQALTIASKDPIGRQIIGDGNYAIRGVGPWYEGDNLIGVVAFVTLGQPRTIEADWPAIVGGEDGSPIETVSHETIQDIRDLTILIDLQKGKIAEVQVVRPTLGETPPRLPRGWVPPADVPPGD